jgi:hypothetical protein
MEDFEIKKNLIIEIKELANKKYSPEISYVVLWGSASALLTIEQLEIMKSFFSK